MSPHALVLGFTDGWTQARQLAQALGADCRQVEVHIFPDGEHRLTLPPALPEHTIIYRSLDHPNEKLVQLLLAADTARALGARRLSLVAPYLCYMRQDAAFHPGEAISQRSIGQLLANLFDEVITVDTHLHRVQHLHDAVPARRSVNVSAAALLGEFLNELDPDTLVLGPDAESLQWVRALAETRGLAYAVAEKQRLGDRQVLVHLPPGDYNKRRVVLVDDMASTGRTLVAAARAVKAAGARTVQCAVTHALFVNHAAEELGAAGVTEVWSTDSIPHPTNRIALAGLLAQTLHADIP